MLTRIAPTPSGFLHLGNVLSFSLTAALAEKTGAGLLLRIDDMDRERANPLYVQDIFDTLAFLQIPWKIGPHDLPDFEARWSQRHRISLYAAALQQLRENGQVFACTCSRAEVRRLTGSSEIYPGTCVGKGLSLDMPGASWRLHTDKKVLVSVYDLISVTVTSHALPAEMQYMVVKKKDGFPAYQLSSLIDDVHFDTGLIVRGQDLWHSTLAQLYVAQVLNLRSFQQVKFYHHQLLTGADDVKLSKSSGSTSIKHLRGQGSRPADIFTLIGNMLGFRHQIPTWQQLAACLL